MTELRFTREEIEKILDDYYPDATILWDEKERVEFINSRNDLCHKWNDTPIDNL